MSKEIFELLFGAPKQKRPLDEVRKEVADRRTVVIGGGSESVQLWADRRYKRG